jgi:acetoin utilization deacetylase AcuC-like enzyme
MQIFYSDHFVLPLPPGHRFPMSKYALLRERVLSSDLAVRARVPPVATETEILRVHTADWLERVCAGRLTEAEERLIGFPWSEEMVERSLRSSGATVCAARAALAEGTSANLAGGTHHAFADHGEGFCVFNDVAIAARAMQAEGRVERVLVIDCDVHQGNGTAAIFAADPSVYTFSIHGERNYPFRKARSSLDIGLEDGTADTAYLEALSRGLATAVEAARADLVIYVAGADAYAGDRLGRLGLSMQGLLARDRMVFEACLTAQLPVAVVMAGGYARVIEDTVSIHFHTLETAAWYCRGGHGGLSSAGGRGQAAID